MLIWEMLWYFTIRVVWANEGKINTIASVIGYDWQYMVWNNSLSKSMYFRSSKELQSYCISGQDLEVAQLSRSAKIVSKVLKKCANLNKKLAVIFYFLGISYNGFYFKKCSKCKDGQFWPAFPSFQKQPHFKEIVIWFFFKLYIELFWIWVCYISL